MFSKLKRSIAVFCSVVLFVSSISLNCFADTDTASDDSDNKVTTSASTEISKTSYASYSDKFSFDVADKTVTKKIGKTVSNSQLSFEMDIPEDGLYNFGLSYMGTGEETGDIVFGLKIDGKYPFDESKKLNLYRIFTNAEGGNRVDGLGNEFAPKQVPYTDYYFDNVADITRWSDEDYQFSLSKGKHTFTLISGVGSFKIDEVSLSGANEVEKYQKPTDKSELYTGKSIVVEGEDAKIKTGYWLAAKTDNSTIDITPNDAFNTFANYIGGSNWKSSGQTLTWEIPVSKSGYYKLGFSYRQSTLIGAKVYRSLKIDGETPFKEAESIGFGYSDKWQQGFFENSKGKPYYIYLSEGTHKLSLEVTSGDITKARDILKQAVAELGDLYVDITMITGESVDIYRDYDLFAQIPNMKETLYNIYKELLSAGKQLQKITGEKTGSYISIIDNMKQICKLMLQNRYTAHRYKDEYYSKYTSLASVLYEMSDMPLDIDRLSLTSATAETPFSKSNFVDKAVFSVRKFVASFVNDYNNISGTGEGEDSITLWVNWGRDQAQVLNSLIQSEFTPQSNIKVNVQIVNASVVQAVLSGKGPDCLLQHSRSEPVNLAMRGMLYDLKQFDDCDEVLKNFQDNAELPYYYKGGLYGLPDTQSFYLMFYRTDIFKEMGLKVPETWDDFKEVTKLLTRNNLSVWMPNNTVTTTTQANIGIGSINLFPTLLVQQKLQVYKEDGRATNLTDSDVIVSFGKWTDFYTKLMLPRTMNFYNRFRTGTCPMGIDMYTQYTTLKAAAPEIDGLWNVALVPGTVDEKGNINHATSGGGTACSILKLSNNPKAAWEFLKWWVSKDTQLAYSSEVESILGPTGRVSVSNVEAFKSLEWDKSMEDVVISAMEQTEEIPEYPGSYYVSRSVYQAFWNVVENKQNTKKMLLKYAEEANEEIARKWKQYENR